ncbi:formimidoylglutamase [Peptoniphilus equinus]|uniref:Formimidoylglutamase n=1 Tax=Peptoniphilus equinus TaxID=3016343 RepID=A0ABY7QSR6_9FIRM|nr:formimidoylglutamase [Peptoniphilus equinus]WBW49835.1 formimidoylglutamase [Peptoniphilus equinus]
MIKNYSLELPTSWTGRVDSESDYDAFRWHQWVERIDLDDASLKPFEGKLAFGILGFECDWGIAQNKGRVGAANGPKSIRRALSSLPCDFPKDVKIFDCGNIYPEGLTLSEAQHSLAQAVEKIIDLNMFPILLGGGHEIAFGHFSGIFEKYVNDGKLGIINFDAHFDNRPYKDNGPSSGTMFRQARDKMVEAGKAFHYLPIGIQRHSNTVSLFKFMEENDQDYILAKDIVNGQLYKNFEIIDKFLLEMDHVYVTICSDVFSSSYAPGVSAPQPLGLDPEVVLVFLKHIVLSGKVVSFDVAEVSPRYDQDSATSSLAAVLIYATVHAVISQYFDM